MGRAERCLGRYMCEFKIQMLLVPSTLVELMGDSLYVRDTGSDSDVSKNSAAGKLSEWLAGYWVGWQAGWLTGQLVDR